MNTNNKIKQSKLSCLDEVINGVSHTSLTNTAYSILEGNLIKYGNKLSDDHKNALYELLSNYTNLIQGTIQGRLAFGLDTGMGKTESIVAFITALHQTGNNKVSVLVCQSKVEGLCELKRKLIAMGVPEEKIGLTHSYNYDVTKVQNNKPTSDNYASLPATPNDDLRQFQLVTHQRVRVKSKHTGESLLNKVNTYQGNTRTLAIWDESLLVSDALSIVERDLEASKDMLRIYYGGSPSYQSLYSYVKQSWETVRAELDSQKAGNDPKLIRFAELDSETINLYQGLVNLITGETSSYKDTLLPLLDMSNVDLKLLTTQQGDGILSYNVAVPKELSNVVVLDASWWIRKLEQLDSSIKSVSKYIKPDLKRYNNVTIHQMPSYGGRHSMALDLGSKRNQRKTSKELGAVIKSIPETEGVLIFTYKQRGRGIDFVRTLTEDLIELGVDTDALIDVEVNGELVSKPRVNFLTWGSETSLNEFSYCSNVILAGVLHRSHIDIASAIAGQRNDLMSDIKHVDIMEVLNSEIAHLAFQAFSRGSCRKVSNGYAGAMKAWLIHADLDIRPLLDRVMSGVKWELWNEVDPTNKGIITRTAIKILAWLDNKSDKLDKVSTSVLRKELELSTIAPKTWTASLSTALGKTKKWKLDGRSVVRSNCYSEFFQ